MSRPTKEDLEEAEWQETGRMGCLIPDNDSDGGDADDDESDEEENDDE